jgi:DNA-binding LacI/PurR family transcriptional regulator/DNA-binding transcriptional regulator YhcF (GntR family)
MRRSRPAQSAADALLHKLVAQQRGGTNARLPVVRDLAAMAGVSYVTMWKAVRELRDAGAIRTNHRTGITVTGVSPAVGSPAARPVAPRAPSFTWERVCHRIQQDVLNGVYPPGTDLRPRKELMRTYGVCRDTLHKALQKLVDEDFLVPYRRGYRVPRPVAGTQRGTVVLVAQGLADGRPTVTTNRSQDCLRALEGECARCGARLSICTPASVSGGALTESELGPALRSRYANTTDVLGFVVWPIGFFSAAGTALLVRELLAVGRPVAVLDETGQTPLPRIAGSRYQVFQSAGTASPGSDVGRHLLRLGHRRVAYISPVHAEAWSRARLAGLTRAFDTAGFEGAVQGYTVDRSWYPRGGIDLEPHMRRVAEGAGEVPDAEGARFVRAVRSCGDDIRMAIRREAMHERLSVLLEQALAQRAATAWVAASDEFALDCIEFLAGHGLEVPGDISVVGFDDTHQAFQHGLTSYNFNAGAVMHAMVRHLFGRHREGARRRVSDPLEVRGFINVRRTTGKPRRHGS